MPRNRLPKPVMAHGLVYVTSGFFKPSLFAIRPDGRGDVTKTHIEWKYNKGVSLTPSPIVVGNEIYMVSDNGIVTCLDALTGEEVWRQRLEAATQRRRCWRAGGSTSSMKRG